jgi:hypothetical protein
MQEPNKRKASASGPWWLSMPAAASLIIVAVSLVYWPVVHADFVWDDLIDFRDNAWLTHGDAWMHYVLKDFNYWINYFRPLIVAFFTLQVRLFDASSGPMHAVNLGMHLVNTVLVGLVARQSCRIGNRSHEQTIWMVWLCMLLYGLHPILIEPVAWIGCQFDLGATLFMLLGLLANTGIRASVARAAWVALLFFLAATCKESAVSFPLILGVFDWAILSRHDRRDIRGVTTAFFKRNWLTYVAILVAGLAYLILRHWALGHLIGQFARRSSSIFGRIQEVCFLYLHYWKTLFLPMSGMGPVHPFDTHQFSLASPSSLLSDATAISTVAVGLYFAIRRGSALGCIVVAMTAALFPVLHITSVTFDTSLYHERYVMTGLATACGMLPLVRSPWIERLCLHPRGKLAIGIICTSWFLFAIAAIRTTIPLWSNSINLWQWAHTVSPSSLDADNNLLSAYIENKDYAKAQELIDQLQSEHVQCTHCMLNAATLAIAEKKPDQALAALEYVKNSKEIVVDKSLFSQYLLFTGRALIQKNDLLDAESLFRAAIRSNPFDPQPRLGLSIALALQGQAVQARQEVTSAATLLPASKRNDAHKNIEQIIQMANRREQPRTTRP